MAQGLLLIVVGVWLLLQTLVGDLPKRVMSYRSSASSVIPSSASSTPKTPGVTSA